MPPPRSTVHALACALWMATVGCEASATRAPAAPSAPSADGAAVAVDAPVASKPPPTPDAGSMGAGSEALRMYFFADLGAELEPCGCRPDMAGGLDHAAAAIAPRRAGARPLVFAAGATLLGAEALTGSAARTAQDLRKAQALGAALAALGLSAWAPTPTELAQREPLKRAAAWPSVPALGNAVPTDAPAAVESPIVPHRVFERAGLRIGVTALALGDALDTDIAVVAERLHRSLLAAAPPSDLQVLLVARATRASVHALLARVPQFAVALWARGEADPAGQEAGLPAERVGTTWVLHPASGGRELAVVEVVRTGGGPQVRPATPIAVGERLGSAPAVAAHIAAYHVDVAAMAAAGSTAAAVTATAEDHAGSAGYTGEGACRGCHDAAWAFWNNTRHARAYWTLQQRQRTGDLECVGCHVTGYGQPGGSHGLQVSGLQAVQCEVCHGPGGAHVEDGQRASITRVPERARCRACHVPPHVTPDWDLDVAWARILGPGHQASDPVAAGAPNARAPGGHR